MRVVGKSSQHRKGDMKMFIVVAFVGSKITWLLQSVGGIGGFNGRMTSLHACD